MIETLENKIYESVNKHGVWRLGLIPTALILDTKLDIKKRNITDLGDKVWCYAYSGIIEFLKFGTGYLLYEIYEFGKKLI